MNDDMKIKKLTFVLGEIIRTFDHKMNMQAKRLAVNEAKNLLQRIKKYDNEDKNKKDER